MLADERHQLSKLEASNGATYKDGQNGKERRCLNVFDPEELAGALTIKYTILCFYRQEPGRLVA
jgi:hypothetical protein